MPSFEDILMRIALPVYVVAAVTAVYLGIRRAVGWHGFFTRMKVLSSKKIRFLLVIMDGETTDEYVAERIDVLVCSSVLTEEYGLNGKGARFLEYELGQRCKPVIDKMIRSNKLNFIIIAESEYDSMPGITFSIDTLSESSLRLIAPLRKEFLRLPRRIS
jgi:hypothetical protein